MRAQGMNQLLDHEYIAIFDADFKPDPDFLVSYYWHAFMPVCHKDKRAGVTQYGSVADNKAGASYLQMPSATMYSSAGADDIGAVPHRQPWHRVRAGALGVHKP